MSDDPNRLALVASWSRFLSVLDDGRVVETAKSLQQMFGATYLRGQNFLSISSESVKSRIWWLVKYVYSRLPRPLIFTYTYNLGLLANTSNILKYVVKLKPMNSIQLLLNDKNRSGMSVSHDIINLMDGFAYEVAQYHVLDKYQQARGFELIRGAEATSLLCHEIVFKKASEKD